MTCYLCNSDNHSVIHVGVRDRDDINVLKCNQCGLVYLSSISHITDEFYEESGMFNGKLDLTNYRKNSFKDDKRRFDFLQEDLIGKDLLDFGCGAGGFLHFSKEAANEINGIELDKAIRNTLNEEGISCYGNLSEITKKYDYITLFHVLEHIPNPTELIKELKQFLKPQGKIIIEIPSADDALITLYESEEFKKFTYWSCHLYLYNPYTLTKICGNAGMTVNYVKQVQRYSLSNHLHWLAKGKPGGHKAWKALNKDILDEEYAAILASLGKCDTLLCECTL